MISAIANNTIFGNGPSSIGLVERPSAGVAKAVKVQELRSVRAVKRIGEKSILMDELDVKSFKRQVDLMIRLEDDRELT